MPFAFDIETLSPKERAVVLSAAILYFEDDKEYTQDELFENTLFVKFSVEEQVKKYKREITKDTVDWWNRQCDIVKRVSLFPSKSDDVSVFDGIKTLQSFIKAHSKKEELVFIRGSLDQFVIDDLCDEIGEPPIFFYSQYLDFRTAIYFLKETNKRGYCEIPKDKFDINKIYKHDPRHDIVYDVMMLLEGI